MFTSASNSKRERGRIDIRYRSQVCSFLQVRQHHAGQGAKNAPSGSMIAAGIAIMLVTIQVPLTHTEFSSSAVHVLIHRLLASVCVGMQSM